MRNKLLSLLLASSMILTSMINIPVEGRAETRTQSVKEEVNTLLSNGNYENGEILAVMKADPSSKALSLDNYKIETISTIDSTDYYNYMDDNNSYDQFAGQSFSGKEELYLVKVDANNTSTEKLLTDFLSDERVLMAEPNYTFEIDGESDDSEGQSSISKSTNDLSSFQWGYYNDGTFQNSQGSQSVEKFDMAETNWKSCNIDGDSSNKNAKGVVAVIDTGIDYTHPDLRNIMIDDMTQYNTAGGKYGYDAYKNDHSEPMDSNSHGTHCAGIIAAEWNKEGTSGIANGIQLTAVKINAGGSNNVCVESALRGYEYLSTAMDNGLDLVAINCSWGGVFFSEILNLVTYEIGEKGAISIFASGNESIDMDKVPQGANRLKHNPYVLIVDSACKDETISNFSNYGESSTDLFAPGEEILSTIPVDNSNYLMEADPNPLVFEGFHDDSKSDTVLFGEFDQNQKKPELQIEEGDDRKLVYKEVSYSRVTKLGYENSDCIAISKDNISRLSEMYCLLTYIKTPKQLLQQINYFSVSLSNSDIANAYMYIKDEEGEYHWQSLSHPKTDVGDAQWTSLTCDLSDINKAQIYSYPLNEELYIPVLLSFEQDEDSDNSENGQNNLDTLFLDQIGFGGNVSTPYQYKNGTSMAAPAVTGAAAIIANRQSGNTNTAESAKERANILRGSVHPYDEFANASRQGGMLDLSIAREEYVPVINSLEESGNQIIIDGAFFGENGSLTIEGLSLENITWSDSRITATCDNLEISKNYKVTVTAENGHKSHNAFILNAEKDSSGLFDKTESLPAKKDAYQKAKNVNMMGYDGKLYVLFTQDVNEPSFYDLWSYDLQTKTWTMCSHLPKVSKQVSMAPCNNGILVYNMYEKDGYYYSDLYLYNSKENKWTTLTCKSNDGTVGATLTLFNGSYYLLGGLYGENDDYSLNIWKANIKLESYSCQKISTVDCAGGSFNQTGIQAASLSDCLYIYSSKANTDVIDKRALIKGVFNGKTFTWTDLTDALPKMDTDLLSNYNYAIAADENYLYLPGIYSDDYRNQTSDNYLYDTYCMAYGANGFLPYARRMYPSQLIKSFSCVYKDRLYVIANTEDAQNNEPTWVIRSTAVEEAKFVIPTLQSDKPATTAVKPATTAAKKTTTAAKKTTTPTVKVSATNIRKITKKSGGKLVIKWKKIKGVTGYRIKYVWNKKIKYKTVKGANKTSVTLTKLKKKKKYTIYIQCYKTVKGKKYYSSFSKKKTVKTK